MAVSISISLDSTPELIGEGNMNPAIASTHALLMSLEEPTSTTARHELSSWRTEAMELLEDVTGNPAQAKTLVDDLLAGRQPRLEAMTEIIAKVREILDANVQLAHAEY